VLTDVVRSGLSDNSTMRPSANECHLALKKITLARLEAEASAQHERLSASRALLESSLQGLQPADRARRQAEIEAYAAQAEHDMAALRAAHELGAESSACELVPYLLVSRHMTAVTMPPWADAAAMRATTAPFAAVVMSPTMLRTPPLLAMPTATLAVPWATSAAPAAPVRGSGAEGNHSVG
jgi:hypothetical protein